MPPFETYSLTEILRDLKLKGFHHAFIITKGRAHLAESNDTFGPELVTLVGIYRIEGDSNNDEEAVVYALETRTGVKGVIVDSFGRFADQEIAEFISKLKTIKAGR